MRQLRIKRIFALLLAVMLCIGGLTSTATWISAAQETFINPKTGFRNNTLINRVLEEDGFLYGINYVWIEEGHTFGDNHIFGYDTNTFSDGNGAEIVYTNMLNLKALGYNCVQIMASGNRMEGIRFDERGQVLGLDEEYKANFRRYLQAIVAADMPFGVVLQSHTTRLYEYIGKTAWDQGTQYYCNPQVRKQYMELVMEPLLEIIAEFEEHLLFLAFGDELENEINDVTVDWNVSGGRGVYGVSFEDMYAFYSDLNDLCKEMLPDIPRTLAGNADFITQYGDLNLDFLGRNNYYSDESVTPIEQYKIGLPMYAPEWGLTVWSNPMSTEEYINGSLAMSANLREAGYLGAFYWSFDHSQKSDAECTLFNTYYEFSSDFSTFATALTYQALDYRYAHQGVGDPFDVPAIFAYQGDGVVTWLRSRQAKIFDLERSVDGGKSWTKLLSNAAAADYVAPRNDEIGYYVDTAVEEGDAAIYRVTARRADGATRMSAPSVQVFPEEVSADESGTELPTEEDDNNLVLNGNFSLGAEGWRFNGTGTGVVNGALYLPGPSEFCSEAISQKITVEPNREYILSYDMKSANGSIMGVYIKRGSNNSILCEDWPVTSVGQWETKMLRFNVGDNSSVTLSFSNATVGDKYVDNVSLTLVDTGKVRYSVTDFVPSKLTCADESKNLLNDPGFEGAGGAWDTDTFVDGTIVTVATDGQNAHSGNRYLQYTGQGLTDTHRAIFYVDVAPHTNYTFSAWVRGHYLSDENNGDVTFGVFDPDTGNYLVAQPWDYLEGYKRDSNEKRSLVPTAFDGDWHLRGMNFDTEDMTRIGIMISGTDARMDLDDLTLCKSADAVAYRHLQNTTNLTTTLYLGERGCAPENNLLPNWDLEEADTAYWSNVDGYGRFVVIEDVRELGFGHSLHYTGTERPLGNVYIRWMTVKPYTDYVLSFSIKVEQEGAGFVGLLDGDTAVPDWFDQIEFLQDYYGDEWGTFSFCFNSDVFSRVGLAIADYGGEAYLDNFRLFRVEDAAPLVNVDPYASVKNGWHKEDGKWAYYENDVKVANKWVKDSVGWCYLGEDGYAVTNCWKKDSKGWCYLNGSGSMTKNAWVKDNGKWYFLDANGYMVTNAWKKDSKGWVYVGSDGAMLTNAWCKDSQGWCYVGANGYAVTNTWKKDSHGWCYLNGSGSMTKN
ncbi:MAG: carbohydrate binding domain-containing protein, partial [Clostridia bacterium]|nr:carbohydrate binding domain-containing protein [Clostridia bacterium]